MQSPPMSLLPLLTPSPPHIPALLHYRQVYHFSRPQHRPVRRLHLSSRLQHHQHPHLLDPNLPSTSPHGCLYNSNIPPCLSTADTNDTFTSISVGSIATDIRTIAFCASASTAEDPFDNPSATFCINISLPTNVKTSLFTPMTNAARSSLAAGASTTQSGGVALGLYPGESAYVAFQPEHQVRLLSPTTAM